MLSALLLLPLMFVAVEVDVEFDVVGNEAHGDGFLLAELEFWLADLRKQPQDAALLDDAAYALAGVYREAGFPDARVQSSKRLVDGRWKITFTVVEGSRWQVGDTEWVGNVAVPTDELDAACRWPRGGILGIGPRLFSQEQLATNRAAVLLLYRLRGYLDATVRAEQRTDRSDDSVTLVHLRIIIDEGQQSTVGEIRVDAPVGIDPDAVRQATRVARGDPLTPRTVAEVRSRLQRWLADRAHYGARVDVRASTSAGRAVLDVGIEVAAKARFGSIDIQGQEHVRRAWIARRIEIQPGEPFSQTALEDAERRLMATGLFITVIIAAVPDSSDPALIHVHATVKEKKRIRVGLRLGYGSYELGRAGVELFHRNLFGTGVQGDANAKVSFRGEEVDLGLKYPFLFGQRLSVETRVSYSRRERASFDEQELEATAGVSITLSRHLTVRAGYSWSETQLHEVEADVPPDEQEDSRTALLYWQGAYDSRDSLLDPRHGLFCRLRLEVANEVLGSELDFVRSTLGVTALRSFGKRWTLILRGRTGIIDPEGDLPLGERFYLGGAHSVRSFKEEELGPRDAANNPLGGEAFVEGSVELRVSVWRRFGAALFVGWGPLVEDSQDIGGGRYQHAVGVGAFLRTPIGPLRVDFAANPDRASGEDDWVVHVLLGHPF